MITAAEALELYRGSGAEVAAYIEKNIASQVKARAAEGGRSVTIHFGTMEFYEYADQKVSPIEKGVIEELRRLDYVVSLGPYGGRYLPASREDVEGATEVQNYGILVSW